MRAGADFRIDDFSGGINLLDDPADVPPGQALDLRNYRRFGKGMRRRDGDRQLGANITGAQSLIGLVNLGDFMFLVDVNTGFLTVYKIDPAPTTATITNLGSIATVLIGGEATFGTRAPIISGQGPYYFMAQGARFQTDGTAAPAAWSATVGTVPQGVAMTQAANRIWVAGLTAAYAGLADPASGLAWSDIGNPRSWPTANATMFAPSDGEDVIGLYRLGDGLVVMKRSRSWFVYDLDTSASREIGFGSGGLGYRAGCETPFGLAYLNPDRGLMLTDGGSVKVLDSSLRYAVRQVATNPLLVKQAQMLYHEDCLFIDLPLVGFYEYEFDSKSWWRHDSSVGIGTVLDTFEDQLYAVQGLPGAHRFARVFEPDWTNYADGNPVTPEWYSGLLDFGDRSRKRITSMTVDGEPDVGALDVAGLLNVYDDTILRSPQNLIGTVTGRVPLRLHALPPRTRYAFVLHNFPTVSTVTARLNLRGRR